MKMHYLLEPVRKFLRPFVAALAGCAAYGGSASSAVAPKPIGLTCTAPNGAICANGRNPERVNEASTSPFGASPDHRTTTTTPSHSCMSPGRTADRVETCKDRFDRHRLLRALPDVAMANGASARASLRDVFAT
jgi:hypothetical protein